MNQFLSTKLKIVDNEKSKLIDNKLKMIDDEIKLVDDKKLKLVNDEYQKMESDIRDIKEIVKDTREILVQQGEQIDEMDDQISLITDTTKHSQKELNSISKIMGKSSIMKPVIVGLLGVTVLGPLGAYMGMTGIPLTTICSLGAIAGVMYS